MNSEDVEELAKQTLQSTEDVEMRVNDNKLVLVKLLLRENRSRLDRSPVMG